MILACLCPIFADTKFPFVLHGAKWRTGEFSAKKHFSFKCWNIIFVLFWSGFFKGFVDFRWFGDFPANYNFFESTTCFCHYTNRGIRNFLSTEFGVARLIRDLFVRSMAMIRSSTYASWFHKAKKMRNISVVMKLVSYRWDKASSG